VLSFAAAMKCVKLILFCCKKYKYRATFWDEKGGEKSKSRRIFTNSGNESGMFLKSGKAILKQLLRTE
jgi:hypothetical protein